MSEPIDQRLDRENEERLARAIQLHWDAAEEVWSNDSGSVKLTGPGWWDYLAACGEHGGPLVIKQDEGVPCEECGQSGRAYVHRRKGSQYGSWWNLCEEHLASTRAYYAEHFPDQEIAES